MYKSEKGSELANNVIVLCASTQPIDMYRDDGQDKRKVGPSDPYAEYRNKKNL